MKGILCERHLLQFALVCCFLLVYIMPVITQDADNSNNTMMPLSQQSASDGLIKNGISSDSDQKPSVPPNRLLETWPKFRSEFRGFTLNMDQFLDQVEAFGINFEDLPVYLTFLTVSLSNLEKARLAEQQAAHEGRNEMLAAIAGERAGREAAERSRDNWRTAALVTGSIILVGVITGVVIWRFP